MTILRPGKKRRDPLGRHLCQACRTLFEVSAGDLAKEGVVRAPVAGNDRFVDCPFCGGWVLINGTGAEEPPAP